MQYKNPGPPPSATPQLFFFILVINEVRGLRTEVRTHQTSQRCSISASESGITGGHSLPFKVPSLHPSRTSIPRACIDDRVDVVWWVLWDAGQDCGSLKAWGVDSAVSFDLVKLLD